MYSPKISEDLIPLIYRAAKSDRVPMTAWVNQAVENALALREQPQNPEPQIAESSKRKESHE
jgi:hypothetical protein